MIISLHGGPVGGAMADAAPVVHCRSCRMRGVGSVPDTPPARWEVVLVNRTYGGGQRLGGNLPAMPA